jgi:hypothetical protein
VHEGVAMESQHHSETELVRSFLHDRDIGCPCCRYNLRGAAGDSCPECGAKLELHVGSINFKLGAWLIGLLAVAFPLGLAGILSATGAYAAWRQSFWWRENDWITIGVLWGLTLFYSIVLIVIIRRRPRFLRLSPLEQRVRAWGTVVVMATLQVLLLYLFKRYGPEMLF